MPIQREIWVQDIIENVFPAGSFAQFAVNHDSHVSEGVTVHVPRAGSSPTVSRNRSVLPASVGQRLDTELTYTLTEYTTDPVHLRHADRFELSYDKRMSVLGEHLAALREAVQEDLLYNWLGSAGGAGAFPAANIVETTGSITTDKRALTLADLLKVKMAMDRANVLQEDRYLLLPPELYGDLFSIPELLQAEAMNRQSLPEGVIARVLGFNVLMRSTMPVFDASKALKPRGATVGSTDRPAAIAWSRFSVCRALGEVQFFENSQDPLYYGDVYSALVRAGGIRMRNNGVFVLLPANA